MTEKWVYISGMDDLHGPMPEPEAWAMANDQNRLNLELNANRPHHQSVYTIAIVLDKPDYKPNLWAFTEDHPADNPIDGVGESGVMG